MLTRSQRNTLKRYNVKYLLSSGLDPKTAKSNALSDEYTTYIQYLAPHTLGGHNVCPAASSGCVESCLHTAGVPFMMQVKGPARLNRKALYFEERDTYDALLRHELTRAQEHAESLGKRLAVRLNGTSDIVWERQAPWLFTEFPNVQFYDYTKLIARTRREWQLPANYDLTLSRSERNHDACVETLRHGGRVAAVFSTSRTRDLPSTHDGFAIVNGDKHDLTFTQPRGVWLGLRAKGKARKDASGFVIQVA